MTMTTCRTCGKDVHITHSADECPECSDGETPNLRTPDCLKKDLHEPEPRDEPARDAPDVF